MAIDADITNAVDQIEFATHEPQSLRDTLNALLVALSGAPRALSFPTDPRTALPELDLDNIGEYLTATRAALIHGGIGKEPE